jgi:hypothetical protein
MIEKPDFVPRLWCRIRAGAVDRIMPARYSQGFAVAARPTSKGRVITIHQAPPPAIAAHCDPCTGRAMLCA